MCIRDRLQPLWSVMIKSYECANYLCETLASVLASYSRLEIADDYSIKDDLEAVKREIAGDRAADPFFKTYHDFKYIYRKCHNCVKTPS